MKKIILFSILPLLGFGQLAAQTYEYVPFVREGVKWICYYDNFGEFAPIDKYYPSGKNYFELEIKGDTIINGKQYKAMHKYYSGGINSECDTIPVYLREENKVVYGIVTQNIYPSLIVGYGPEIGANPSIYHIVATGEEFVLYNFDDPESYYEDILWWYVQRNEFDYLDNDTISLGGGNVKRHRFNSRGEDIYIIEGIGYDGGLEMQSGYTLGYLFCERQPTPPFRLSHVVENGHIIYKGTGYDPDVHVGIDEVAADRAARPVDGNYYNLMGQPMGTEVPSVPGIYIHQGRKIVVR